MRFLKVHWSFTCKKNKHKHYIALVKLLRLGLHAELQHPLDIKYTEGIPYSCEKQRLRGIGGSRTCGHRHIKIKNIVWLLTTLAIRHRRPLLVGNNL